MIITLLMIVTFVVGFVFSFGPSILSAFLTLVGSFERLSWVSLIGFAILTLYWIILAINLYQYANAERENVEDGNFVKVGRTALIIGMVLTALWIALFVTTDKVAIAAGDFNAWRAEYAYRLQVAQKIGHLLLAFSAGIFVSLFSRMKKRKKKSANSSQENNASLGQKK